MIPRERGKAYVRDQFNDMLDIYHTSVSVFQTIRFFEYAAVYFCKRFQIDLTISFTVAHIKCVLNSTR